MEINRILFYPYRNGSKSINTLRESADLFQYPVMNIRLTNSRFKHTTNKLVVNWGNSERPPWWDDECPHLNHPDAIKMAADKRKTFQVLEEADVSIPEFELNARDAVAHGWDDIMVRTIVTGNSGRGCFLASEHPDGVLERGKLFTKYIKKTFEYRVHVFNKEVFDVQQKKLSIARRDAGDYSVKIRNHQNGWVFTRNDIDEPDQSILDESVKAVEALGLDFGAVDIIWNRFHGAFVLEVNTAPGLEGTTLTNYVNQINTYATGGE